MQSYLIKNCKAIITCNQTDEVYYDQDIWVRGSKIQQIGKNLTVEGAQHIDGKDKYIYPGLINTHHHFFQAFVRNLVTIDKPNMATLTEWLSVIYDVFRFVDSDVIYYSSLAAMADLIKHGCTTAMDHQYCYTIYTGNTPVDRQMEAAAQLGMRFVAARGTNTLPMSEGSTIPDEMCETTDEYLKDCERIIKLYHDPEKFSMRQIVMAPCQPINCYKETFTETLAMARKHGVFMHTHLCEGENAQMVERWGKRSIAWCEEIGFLGPDISIAHGRETIPYEYEVLAKYGTGISHCPAATFYGATQPLDMPALMKAGVVVGLGTDGCSTNEGSSMLEALRLAYLMQTYRNVARTGCPQPYDILKMGTVNGAKLLGRSEDLGSLEAGKAADLFMIDVGTLEYAGALHDPKSIIPKLGIGGPVWMTMINGEIVFKDGELTRVDDRKLAREGEEVCTRVLRSKCDVFKKLK